MLALGALGLAAALTLAAFAAPDGGPRAASTYTPTDPEQVIARVPTRDAAEVAARRRLAESPDQVEVALQLARVDIQRYRTLADPRYLGRAQATLDRWWKLAQAPPEVRMLRATINHALLELAAARADLDKLVELRPTDDQAHLLRATVATMTADYAAARASCTAIANQLVSAACTAPLDGIAGKAGEAYTRLSGLLPTVTVEPATRAWIMTVLAELALQAGDTASASRHLVDALGLDEDHLHARNLLCDILLETGRAAEASKLLAGRESIDSHLVRLAIAEHAVRGPDRERLAGLMRERIEAAAVRGDRIHRRDEARFMLGVEQTPARAVELARENWDAQKEVADARLLAAAAAAAHDRAAAEPVIAWARATGVRDAWLARSFATLGVQP